MVLCVKEPTATAEGGYVCVNGSSVWAPDPTLSNECNVLCCVWVLHFFLSKLIVCYRELLQHTHCESTEIACVQLHSISVLLWAQSQSVCKQFSFSVHYHWRCASGLLILIQFRWLTTAANKIAFKVTNLCCALFCVQCEKQTTKKWNIFKM